MSEGLCLEGKTAWEISPPADYASFFFALEKILPEDAIFYIEGTYICKDVRSYFQSAQIEPEIHIAVGTLYPKPEIYHVPITSQVIKNMIDFFEHFAQPEVCDHFHVYSKGIILLQWHDAFNTDSFLLSETISEEKVKAFCKTAGCIYSSVELSR